MNALLEDVRLLKLAEARQAAFAALLLELATTALRDHPSLDLLRERLCAAERHRAEIARHLRRLNAALVPLDAREVERAAFLDLAEAARTERDHHRGLAARLHDPEAADLLRRLADAKESESHALDALGGRILPPDTGFPPPLPARSALRASPRGA